MEKLPQVIATEEGINPIICKYFATGCGAKIYPCEEAGDNIATFGILRGTGDVIKRAKEFWYIDHAYLGRDKLAKWGRGYFRIVHNAFWHNGKGDYPPDRLEKIVPHMNEWRTVGDHVIVVPPSTRMSTFLGLENWLDDTITKIKKHTDRKIIISRKISKKQRDVVFDKGCMYTEDLSQKSLKILFKKAWVLVTDHSNSAMEAMIRGVPVIMTNPQRKFSRIEDIETPLLDRSILNTLAYQQWRVEDIQTGQAWSELTQGVSN